MSQSSEFSIIVLAAGRSTRMQGGNKLLSVVDGEAVLTRTIQQARGSDVGEIILVTGHDAAAISRIADALGVRIVENADYADGMASSIVAGVRASKASDGFLILPGDMPLIESTTIRHLVSRFVRGRILLPTFRRRRGHPVLFASRFRHELIGLTGDLGARILLERHRDVVIEVPVDDPGVLVDIDTRADLERLDGAAATSRPLRN